MLHSRVLVFVLVAVTYAYPASGQVRQATPEDLGADKLIEVASPMLADISLGGGEKKKPLGDPGVNGRTLYDTKPYVCDKARVPRITVMKRANRKGGFDLEVTPVLMTEWYRQDVNLTLAILSEGKLIRRKDWKAMTIGNDNSAANKMGVWAAGASTTKQPVATFAFGPGEFEGLFGEGKAPTLRLILEIVDAEEDD